MILETKLNLKKEIFTSKNCQKSKTFLQKINSCYKKIMANWLKINYTLTKTNEHLTILEPRENSWSERENSAFPPKIKFGKQPSKPDLKVCCLLCNTQFKVKYIPPKKQYSLKNNWGYWTQKESNQNKYLCNACLVKILAGKKFDAFDWIPANKAANFRSYLARGDFGKR